MSGLNDAATVSRPRPSREARRRFAGALLLTVGLGAAASELPVELDVSGDIAWTVGPSLFTDDAMASVTLSGLATEVGLGVLPRSADVMAYDLPGAGQRLFALDTPVDLGFGLVQPQDIVAWNGVNPSLYFDGSVAGVPAGARIDALGHRSHAGSSAILLSFDVTLVLPGGLTAADEDIVAWDGAAWSMVFDGSANGVPARLDVDGYDRDPVSGTQYVSFDVSGAVGGTYFDDEDVVAFDGGVWSLAFDASAGSAGTIATGDLDALAVRLPILFRDGFENAPGFD